MNVSGILYCKASLLRVQTAAWSSPPTSPGSLLETQHFRPQPRPAESESIASGSPGGPCACDPHGWQAVRLSLILLGWVSYHSLVCFPSSEIWGDLLSIIIIFCPFWKFTLFILYCFIGVSRGLRD